MFDRSRRDAIARKRAKESRKFPLRLIESTLGNDRFLISVRIIEVVESIITLRIKDYSALCPNNL